MPKMMILFTAFALLLFAGIVNAQLGFDGRDSDDERVVTLIAPDVAINYSLIPTVNSSDYWDDLDTPADITLTDLDQSTEYWVNETGDTMTGQLIVQSGNGRIISTNSAGAIVVQTSGGDAGYISFGNTADIGISTDGVEGTWDSDGAMIFKQKASNPDGDAEFVFIEENGDWRFALASSGADFGTYNPRSMIIAGASVNNDSNVRCSYWGFDNIDCDTGGTGADLGVQDDVEVGGQVFTAGVRINASGTGFPDITFQGDNDTGWISFGTGIKYDVDGSTIFQTHTTTTTAFNDFNVQGESTFVGQTTHDLGILVGGGLAGVNPYIAFNQDTDTGWGSEGEGQIQGYIADVEVYSFLADSFTTSAHIETTHVPTGQTTTTSSVIINPASATANANLIWAGVNSIAQFEVDEDGDIDMSGGILASGSGTFGGDLRTTSGDVIIADDNLLIMGATGGNDFNMEWDEGTDQWLIRVKGFTAPMINTSLRGVDIRENLTVGDKTTLNDDTTLGTNLYLEESTGSDVGVIYKGGDRFMHDYGEGNLFIGQQAGNFFLNASCTETYHATALTGIGFQALDSVTCGFSNFALGETSLSSCTNCSQNVGIGADTLKGTTTGSSNIGIGQSALSQQTTASNNIAFGRNAGFWVTDGRNIIIGAFAGDSINTGADNVVIGYNTVSAGVVSDTDFNTIVGSRAGFSVQGDNNILIGYSAGTDETGSDQLIIDSIDRGSASESYSEAIISGELDADPTNQILRFNAGEINVSYLPEEDSTATSMYVCWDTDGHLFLNETGC